MARRALVTGNGLVARALRAEAESRGIEVLVASRAGSGADVELELPTDAAALRAALRDFAPDLVFHTAALTSLRACAADPAAAWSSNVDAVRAVVAAAECPIVHFSSDWVFSGGEPPYAVDAPLAPVDFYGVTKAYSEPLVIDAGGLVVRGTFLGRRFDGRRGLVERFLDLEDRVEVPARKRATPLWVGYAAELVLDLAEAGATGPVHVGSRDSIGWPDLAASFRAATGLDAPVAAIETLHARDTSLDVSHAEALLGRSLPSVAETVAATLAERPVRIRATA